MGLFTELADHPENLPDCRGGSAPRALGARLPRRAGRARLPGAPRRRLRQHPRHRPLPRPAQAVLRRRDPRDGQPPPLRFLGQPDRGAPHRPAAKRGQVRRRRRSSTRSTPTPPGSSGFLAAMTGHQPRRQHGDRREVPLGELQSFVDVGTAQGDLAVQVALAHPHLTGRASTCRSARLRGLRRPQRPRRTRRVPPRRLLRGPPPKRRRRHDGAHPPRLGPRREADAHRARPTRRSPPGGALIVYEAIIDDDRSKNVFGLLMSLNMLIETPGRLRLHRRRLHGLDGRGRLPGDPRGAPRRPDSMVVGIKQ